MRDREGKKKRENKERKLIKRQWERERKRERK